MRRCINSAILKNRSTRIETYAKGTGTLEEAPHINRATLKAKGFDDDAIARIEVALPTRVRATICFQQVRAWARTSARSGSA